MLFITLASLVVSPAYAEEDEEDDGSKYLEEDDADKGRKRSSSKKPAAAGSVREIARGFYGKANVGGALYLGGFSGAVSPGTYVALTVGQDFVDNEKQSMAWEIQLQQGLHNGLSWQEQSAATCAAAPCTEGDLRTYSIVALYEFSAYPTRRVGVGGHIGAGVLYSPLLMFRSAYEGEVLPEYGVDPGYHDAPKPVIVVGPTIEYYTKLAHFSVGVDADVFYGIGWDLGLNASGYLKYTF